MDHTIVHFEIPTDDLDRAAKFYRELFGWTVTPVQMPGMEYWTVSTVPIDEAGRPTRQGVNGGMMKRMHPEHQPLNYIGVENVDAYCSKAAELGGSVCMPKTPIPHIGYFAMIKDTEGNILGVFEEDASAA